MGKETICEGGSDDEAEKGNMFGSCFFCTDSRHGLCRDMGKGLGAEPG